MLCNVQLFKFYMIVVIYICAYDGDFTFHLYVYEYSKEKLRCVVTGISN